MKALIPALGLLLGLMIGCGSSLNEDKSETVISGSKVVTSFPVEHESDLVLSMNERPLFYAGEQGIDQDAVLRIEYEHETWRPDIPDEHKISEMRDGTKTYAYYPRSINPLTGNEDAYDKKRLELYFYKDGSIDVKIAPIVSAQMKTYDPSGMVIHERDALTGVFMYRLYQDGTAAMRPMEAKIMGLQKVEHPELNAASKIPGFLIKERTEWCKAHPDKCSVTEESMRVSHLELERPHPQNDDLIMHETFDIGGWSGLSGIEFPDTLVRRSDSSQNIPSMKRDEIYTLVATTEAKPQSQSQGGN